MMVSIPASYLANADVFKLKMKVKINLGASQEEESCATESLV